MRIKAIAIDDEVLALHKISRFCKQVDYMDLVEQFDNPLDAYYYLKHNKIDMLFLDVQMDEMSGIELLGRLETKPFTVLTTAFSHYSLKAFDLDVVDYLLKPIRFERFIKATDKVLERMKRELSYHGKPDAGPEDEDFIFVKSGTRRLKIYLSDILFIGGMKDYLSIQTYKGKFLVLMNFNEMMELIPADRFVRVHRSYIVALDKIDSTGRNNIVINGMDLPVSKTYLEDFRERFNKYVLSK